MLPLRHARHARSHACPRAAGDQSLPECVINPLDKMVRRKWRKFTLVIITTDDRLAATATPGPVWDNAELQPQDPGMGLPMQGGYA